MIVKKLIEKLQEMDQESDVIIDSDKHGGFYTLEGVEPMVDENLGRDFVNLISSSEM